MQPTSPTSSPRPPGAAGAMPRPPVGVAPAADFARPQTSVPPSVASAVLHAEPDADTPLAAAAEGEAPPAQAELTPPADAAAPHVPAARPGRASGVFAPFDPWLASSVTCLLGFGLVVVYSSSAVYAERNHGDALHFLRAQAIWSALGVLAMVAAARLPRGVLMARAAGLYFVTVAALVAVLVPSIGRFVGGARRWLTFGPFTCQPSEAAKLTLVVVLAQVLAKGGGAQGGRRGLAIPILLCQLPVVLILAEPDLGTAIVIELILATLLFASGLRARVLALLVLAALPALYHLIVGTPFRLRRMLSYIDPWAFRSTIGYQVTEALISIGSGGRFGVGLGDGKQKLFFLPEAHTDFIFAILAEELGLVGVGVLLVAFAVFVARGLRLARLARNPFDRFLALGLSCLIGVPAVLNVSVATGLLPTKGLPLPFISYGGSNLLVTLAAVGLLWRVDATVRAKGPWR